MVADGCALSRKGGEMTHLPNRKVSNEPFDDLTILAVWIKGTIVPGYDLNEFRKDQCGAWIRFADYGNINSDLGWEIDHEKPVAKGGTDELKNLQPLHWRNNRSKGDNWPKWSCSYPALR